LDEQEMKRLRALAAAAQPRSGFARDAGSAPS
jgi:hypothetical protein